MNLKKKSRVTRCLIGVAVAVVVAAVSGCRTLSFYSQAFKGQYQLMSERQSVDKLATNANTPEKLKQQLLLLQRLRTFAQHELKLPVNGHYSRYVDVHRPYVVWNVEAAPEFSLQPKGWWYPLVGRLEYRGYFSERGARTYAAGLREKGFDIYVGGVTAYSTLGWFKDPALNTFIFNSEPDLAETIFHELGHQRLFARGDMDFNEAFATTVGEEGARRWLKANSDEPTRQRYLGQLQRTREFVHLVLTARQQLISLYGDDMTEEGKLQATEKNRDVPPETLRRQKQEVFDKLQEDYARLKAERWNGITEYDPWFAQPVNNAKLNSVAAYYELVPGFEHLLQLNGGDLEKFYAAAEKLSNQPKKERHQQLQTFAAQPARGDKL